MECIAGEPQVCETPRGKMESLYFEVQENEYLVKRLLHQNRYQVIGLLAVGGFGCIFGARDSWNHDCEVVIKTPYYMGDYCRPYIARSQKDFERQIRSMNKIYKWEQNNLARFSNQGFDSIVNLNDAFLDCSLDLCQPFRNAAGVEYYVGEECQLEAPYLVMKYIPGEMLRDVIARHPLTQVKALRLAKQILMLMKYLHQTRRSKKGRPFYYLLCDLKAENILVTDEEQMTLIDFGAVKVYWEDQSEIDIPIFVTDGYAAPEVYSGSLEYRDNTRIDSRFDLFTVGTLLCHCLTQKHPREFLISTTPPEHRFELDDHETITKSVKQIILHATERDRTKRYQNVDEMLSAVWKALEELQ